MRLAQKIKFRAFKFLQKFFPTLAYRQRKGRWASNWAKEDFAPSWRVLQAIPPEIKEAVDKGWFKPGSRLVDIGCGTGELAAWLAEQGYQVLGVDYAAPAVERARQLHAPANGQLAFDTVDILNQVPGTTKFEALLDRGCLHNFPDSLVADYVKNVAAAAAPEGAFLLLYGLSLQPEMEPENLSRLRQERGRFLQNAFQPYFQVERMADMVFDRSTGRSPEPPLPGLALWLRRQ